jgi:autotransporter-associated beta strand protein
MALLALTAGTLTGNTTTLQGNITNNAPLVFDQDTNGTYSGIISGAASLTMEGSAILTLSVLNTYSGGSLISGGTLTNALATSGNITVNSGTTFNQAIAGLSGAGSITLGSGDLTASSGNWFFNLSVCGIASSLAFCSQFINACFSELLNSNPNPSFARFAILRNSSFNFLMS